MEDFEAKLHKVNIIDIYNDVAAIDLSAEQLIELCSIFICRVDLSRGNVVYAVEQKYREKLVKYHQKKRIKWLQRNFSYIMPNADEKFLKWQQNHKHKKKVEWLNRKIFALDYLIPLPSLSNYLDEPSCSHSLIAERRRSRYSSSTTVNTSLESLQTVIASQPKNNESDVSSAIIGFSGLSRSTLECSVEELPPVALDDLDELIEPVVPPKISKRVTFGKVFVQESQEVSSQENAYSIFTQDMKVTSTQEFGSE